MQSICCLETARLSSHPVKRQRKLTFKIALVSVSKVISTYGTPRGAEETVGSVSIISETDENIRKINDVSICLSWGSSFESNGATFNHGIRNKRSFVLHSGFLGCNKHGIRGLPVKMEIELLRKVDGGCKFRRILSQTCLHVESQNIRVISPIIDTMNSMFDHWEWMCSPLYCNRFSTFYNHNQVIYSINNSLFSSN